MDIRVFPSCFFYYLTSSILFSESYLDNFYMLMTDEWYNKIEIFMTRREFLMWITKKKKC